MFFSLFLCDCSQAPRQRFSSWAHSLDVNRAECGRDKISSGDIFRLREIPLDPLLLERLQEALPSSLSTDVLKIVVEYTNDPGSIHALMDMDLDVFKKVYHDEDPHPVKILPSGRKCNMRDRDRVDMVMRIVQKKEFFPFWNMYDLFGMAHPSPLVNGTNNAKKLEVEKKYGPFKSRFAWSVLPNDFMDHYSFTEASKMDEKRIVPTQTDLDALKAKVDEVLQAELFDYQLATLRHMRILEEHIRAKHLLQIMTHVDMEWNEQEVSTFPLEDPLYKFGKEKKERPSFRPAKAPFLVDSCDNPMVTIDMKDSCKLDYKDRVIDAFYGVDDSGRHQEPFLVPRHEKGVRQSVTAKERQHLPAQLQRFVRMRGAILGDEMGLGKTLTLIALIACDTDRGTGASDEVVSQADPYKIRNQLDTQRLPFRSVRRLRSSATLVLCPGHIVDQWRKEVARFSHKSRPLKVSVCLTKMHNDKCSNELWATSDIVIVSKEYLVGKYNRDHEEYNFSTLDLEEKSPRMSAFHWRRIVIDEAHEFLDDAFEWFAKLASDMWWCVSATPLAQGAISPLQLMRILGIDMLIKQPRFVHEGWDVFKRPVVLQVLQNAQGKMLAELLSKRLYIRNTQESIESENTIREYTEEILLLDDTDVGELVYHVMRDIQDVAETELFLFTLYPTASSFFCRALGGLTALMEASSYYRDGRLVCNVVAHSTTPSDLNLSAILNAYMHLLYSRLAKHADNLLAGVKGCGELKRQLAEVDGQIRAIQSVNGFNPSDEQHPDTVLYNTLVQDRKGVVGQIYRRLTTHKEVGLMIGRIRAALRAANACKGFGDTTLRSSWNKNDDTFSSSFPESLCNVDVPEEDIKTLKGALLCTTEDAERILAHFGGDLVLTLERYIQPVRQEEWESMFGSVKHGVRVFGSFDEKVVATAAVEKASPSRKRARSKAGEEEMTWEEGAPTTHKEAATTTAVEQKQEVKEEVVVGLDEEETQPRTLDQSTKTSSFFAGTMPSEDKKVHKTTFEMWQELTRANDPFRPRGICKLSCSPDAPLEEVKASFLAFTDDQRKEMSKWGLRFGAIYSYLCGLGAVDSQPDEGKRIIIFSAFTPFLTALQYYLGVRGITAPFAAGNVLSRAKAIRGFQNVDETEGGGADGKAGVKRKRAVKEHDPSEVLTEEGLAQKTMNELKRIIAQYNGAYKASMKKDALVQSAWAAYQARPRKQEAVGESQQQQREAKPALPRDGLYRVCIDRVPDKYIKIDIAQPRVLLMDMTKTATGVNLKDATHVIFTEEGFGDRETLLANQSQARARALRQNRSGKDTRDKLVVVRFLVRGTVEERHYLANHRDVPRTQFPTRPYRCSSYVYASLLFD